MAACRLSWASSSSSRSATCSRTRCGRSANCSDCPRRSSGGIRSLGLAWPSACVGEVTRQRLDILRKADNILLEEIVSNGLYRKTAQTFAVLLPVRSVGVMGDGRTYDNVVAIRSVDTADFMTADWSRIPYDVLATISNRIINEVRGRQPSRLRHLLKAAGDDRMGITKLRMTNGECRIEQQSQTILILFRFATRNS